MDKEFPCKECGGECCNFPTMEKRDYKRVKKYLPKKHKIHKIGEIYVLVTSLADSRCPLFIKNKCSVYPIRPEVCKIYGTVPQMPCQYLYPEKASEFVDKALENINTSFLKVV